MRKIKRSGLQQGISPCQSGLAHQLKCFVIFIFLLIVIFAGHVSQNLTLLHKIHLFVSDFSNFTQMLVFQLLAVAHQTVFEVEVPRHRAIR